MTTQQLSPGKNRVSARIEGLAVCARGGYMAEAITHTGGVRAFAAVVPWSNTGAHL